MAKAKRYTEDELNQIDAQFRALLDGQNRVYIVAESSMAFRKMVVNALRSAGCDKIIEARDGMEALNALKKVGVNGISIIDLKMPVVDGVKYLVTVRKDEQLKTAPIFIMSTETRKSIVIALIRAGATGYLVKPFDAKSLLDKLSSSGLL